MNFSVVCGLNDLLGLPFVWGIDMLIPRDRIYMRLLDNYATRLCTRLILSLRLPHSAKSLKMTSQTCHFVTYVTVSYVGL